MNRDVSYKGYLIRSNSINDRVWIEKGGQFIAWAKNEEEARSTIELLS